MGGGPAGLYSAILLKQALPRARIEVYERNRPDDTFGWGVVFSDQTMAGFAAADAPSHAAIVDSFHHWDDIDVHIHGAIDPHRRPRLRRHRAQAAAQHPAGAGGEPRRRADVPARGSRRGGVRGCGSADRRPTASTAACASSTRRRSSPTSTCASAASSGSARRSAFPAFTFAFERTEHGWFQIHAYQFSTELSTVIVETREETWLAHGLDRATTDESIAFAEQLFGKYLGGARLMSNARHLRGSAWLNFNRVLCRRWFTRNIVLIGDAAHTAHFSIGSGTKLAMEDAIALSREIARGGDVSGALQRYQEERELEALKLQSAARNRMEWFENVARYTHLEPLQFTYSLLTGSQRIGHDNLKLRDAGFVGDIERSLAERAGVADRSCAPMFLPFKLRDLELVNRVVVSPMAQYSAIDGVPNDWHLVHYGARATGGAGLVVSEMTCVSPHGRISPGCTGLWNETQRDAWRRIVDFVHEHTQAKFCLQLGHSGRKGSTQLGWEQADYPLPSDNWPIISASPLPYIEGVSQVPKEASEDGHRDDHRAVRHRGAARPAGRLRHDRAAHGARLSAGELPVAADESAHRSIRRHGRESRALSGARSFARCARSCLRGCRCRCASPRAIGRRAVCATTI